MKFFNYAALFLGAAIFARAQEDGGEGEDGGMEGGMEGGDGEDMSLCDTYTMALLGENNATNQMTVLTLVVNTALIGNYPNPAGEPMNEVTGILNNGTTTEGEMVSLLEYFDGTLASTNRNGQAVSVNFLDGGGAEPLMMNMPANDMESNQYTLVTHLYQVFGSLLGCSMQTEDGPFMTYQGNPSMSQVHRFMNLNQTQNNYFIQQVGLAATSFGVSQEDAMTIGNSLNETFNYRCSPPESLGEGLEAYSQSCCLDSSCPLDPEDSDCTQSGMNYPNGTEGVAPQLATQEDMDAGAMGGSSQGGENGEGGGDDMSDSDSGSDGMNGAHSLIVNVVGALALAAAGVVAVGL